MKGKTKKINIVKRQNERVFAGLFSVLEEDGEDYPDSEGNPKKWIPINFVFLDINIVLLVFTYIFLLSDIFISL